MNEDCLGCEWYNKPYWSIISPCTNCHKRFKKKSVTVTRYSINIDNKELYEENKKLKSTLEEIREYIKHEWFKRGQLGIIDKSFQEWELNNLLQIIDKGVNDE